jgi:predicted AlkP superfamily phosphohydrolase/phosphomutase
MPSRALPLLLAAGACTAFLLTDLVGGSLAKPAPAPAADAATHPRCVVLGFDGVDRRLLAEYLAAGHLSHLAALAKEGGFEALLSEIPPESPVAWASLLTGVNPGRHRIHDFVAADEALTPVNGMVDVKPLRLFLGKFPVRPPIPRSRLAAPTFLERVHAAGYPVLSLRQPHLFPAPSLPGARMLSGLGTPDVSGAAGAYTVWSAAVGFAAGISEFGGAQTPLKRGPVAGRYESVLLGPPDPSLPPGPRGIVARAATPVAFDVLGEGDARRLKVTLGDGVQVLERGAPSAFFAVSFRLATVPAIEVHGIVRLTVRSFDPLIVLGDPVNIDPRRPTIPITTPVEWGAELAEAYGLFETVGWQEQTFALNDFKQDDESFLSDALDDMRRGAAILMGELSRGARCVFQCFTATDRVAHGFWRLRDQDHPMHDPEAARRLGDPILAAYREMDEIVGAVRARLDPADLLLVVSDHGFATWRWGFNVNQWLLDEGYLALRGAMPEKDLGLLFQRGDLGTDVIDWAKTRAVAVGLGQVFLNVKGRNTNGCVEPDAAHALAREIAAKLLALRNPFDEDAAPVRRVFFLHEEYRGPYAHEAGDLQLAFAEGYRVSWQTALLGGFTSGRVLERNERPWSGDHCSTDPEVVPGVVLSNRRLRAAPSDRPYHVRDVAATVLRWFGLPTDDLDGRPLPLGSPETAR